MWAIFPKSTVKSSPGSGVPEEIQRLDNSFSNFKERRKWIGKLPFTTYLPSKKCLITIISKNMTFINNNSLPMDLIIIELVQFQSVMKLRIITWIRGESDRKQEQYRLECANESEHFG